MKLKEIVIGCENCDGVTIKGKYVKGIYLGEIKESYVGFGDDIEKRKKIKDFALYIDKNANVQGKTRGEFSGYSNAFERIGLGKDVTGIMLVFEGHHDYDTTTIKQNFSVEWTNKNDRQAWNPAQDAYITEAGDLCLVISKKKKVKDFFHILKDDDEDEEYVGFHL